MNISIKDYNLAGYYVPDDVKDGVCVDIGANVGCFFEKYASFFSKIYFYEPYKPCYEICLEKTKKYSNVVGFNEAVLDKCSDIVEVLHHFNCDSGSNAIRGNTINEHWDANETIGQCKSVDLETVLQRCSGNIDYLKCDCETSEYNIFYEKNLKNIRYIGMELHWQMGEEKFNQILNHVLKTHDLIFYPGSSPDTLYRIEENKELLFKIKN